MQIQDPIQVKSKIVDENHSIRYLTNISNTKRYSCLE